MTQFMSDVLVKVNTSLASGVQSMSMSTCMSKLTYMYEYYEYEYKYEYKRVQYSTCMHTAVHSNPLFHLGYHSAHV